MNEIAIIGMECRFPKAKNLNEFWNLLSNNEDAISDQYTQRLNSESDAEYFTSGGYIDQYDHFDAEFFNIAAQEARLMDPQQRLMLETSWDALENASINPSDLAGSRTGVFVGVMSSDWGKLSFSDPNTIEVHSGTGNGHCMIANRLSYVYNLHGPSMAVDTACSSSLVAIDLAIRYLQNNDIDLAIVGGVNLILTPTLNAFYQRAGLASADGRCKPFGDKANGIVRGEGVGVVILKRMADAVVDHNPIYCRIKGSAVNHGGLSNGITAPNRWSQAEVIKKALMTAQLSANDIQYIEAHGTGTLLGDPIEASALKDVFGKNNIDPCYLGSVKSNIGHLEGAAGIAGLIKTALAISNQKIPASLHYGTGNPYINFSQANLKVVTQLQEWSNSIRRAGVSAFGLGGTNAHIIVESVADKSKNSMSTYKPVLRNSKVIPLHLPQQHKFDLNSNINNKTMQLTNLICTLAADLTGIPLEKINSDSHFINDLDFDSLMIVDFKTKLEKTLNKVGKVELKEFIMARTVSELVDHLLDM